MSEIPVTVPFVSFRPMERELDAEPVSYTHLTLPTILRV